MPRFPGPCKSHASAEKIQLRSRRPINGCVYYERFWSERLDYAGNVAAGGRRRGNETQEEGIPP
jgi:hypothetical protein